MRSNNIKSKIFLAKYSLVKNKSKQYYNELLKNQTLEKDELEQLNWIRTRELLTYAYEHVPFYRNKFVSIDLHPQDITKPIYFQQIPVVQRNDLQEHFSDFISDEASLSNLRLSTTGGSTGKPVKVYHQKNIVRAAAGWRMLSWWGLRSGVDFASVYRDTRTDWKARMISILTWWPTRRIDLNAADLNVDDINFFIEKFNKHRPKLLHGYVGAINHLASFIQDNSITVHSPHAIWVTSAPLTLPQRERIEAAFPAPVYDQYGSCEIYWLAAQCPLKSALHMFADIRKFEFLDPDNNPVRDGEIGKIVITDLENLLFPLIRYEIGDFGRALPGVCECGVKLPLMDQVKGRISDIIRLPNNKVISGEYMTTIFDHAPDMVKQFQVVQKPDFSIEIRVIPNGEYLDIESGLLAVKKKLSFESENLVSVSIKKMEEIPIEKGKVQFIKSELPSQ